MPENDKIYRTGCETISLNEFYKRIKIGITYFGNVTDIGYVEAPNGYAIKVYYNQNFIGTYTIFTLSRAAQSTNKAEHTDESPEEWRRRKEFELDAMIASAQMLMATASFGAEVKLSLGNYSYLNGLASKNQFLGTYKGDLTVMDNSFLSTKE